MCVLEFLNANSSALMVIITLVYAIATFFIYRANKQSVQAMNAQLIESKRQFSETQRLTSLPFLAVAIGDTYYPKGEINLFPDLFLSLPEKQDSGFWTFVNCGITIKNIGSGLACKLKSCWIVNDKSEEHSLRTTVLRPGDDTFINVGITGTNKDKPFSQKAELAFCFFDVLGNEYEQKLELHLSLFPHASNIKVDSYTMHEPREIPKTKNDR